jgi:hypothetical protein
MVDSYLFNIVRGSCLIYVICIYLCYLYLFMLSVSIYVICIYLCYLYLFMLSVFIYVICIYLCYLYLFMLSVSIYVICIYLCILVSNTISILDDVGVPRTVSHMEQELLTLPEFTPCFKWGSSCSIFSFLCNAL